MPQNTPVTVIYHNNCPDGFGAAFVAWLHFGYAATYYPADYSKPAPNVAGHDVYILDFSYPLRVMEGLDSSASSITLLDHHVSAQEDLEGFQCRCGQIHFDLSKSGARLAWEHFFPLKPCPPLITYVEDRDLWKWEYSETPEFLAFLDMLPYSFEEWHTLLDEKQPAFSDARQIGKYLYKDFLRKCNEIASEAVPIKVEGHTGLMVSCSPSFASKVGEMLYTRTGTFALVWRIEDDANIKLSFRSSPTFDGLALARKFKGGGHRSAAGARIPRRMGKQLVQGHLRAPFFWKCQFALREILSRFVVKKH